jgi:DNA-directed RNA polymerase specialized sigma24 family protein
VRRVAELAGREAKHWRNEVAALRQADQEADRLRDELRLAILEAHEKGKSTREIGRAAGISATRVHQIIHAE